MTRRNTIMVVLGAVAALAVVAILLFDSGDSDLAGETGAVIADRIGEDCATKREQVEADFGGLEPRLGERADEIVRITCEEGEVSPISLIYLFSDSASGRKAVGDPPELEHSHCLVGADAFSLNFDDARQVCRDLGGKLTASEHHRERAADFAAALCEGTPTRRARFVPEIVPGKTRIAPVSPVDWRGCPLRGLRVRQVPGTADCVKFSKTLYGGNVWACGSAGTALDTCWITVLTNATGSSSLCLRRPWSTRVLGFDTDQDLSVGGKPSKQRRWPWAVQLEDGSRCVAYQGAHSIFRGRPIDYYCGESFDNGIRLLRPFDQSGEQWTAESIKQDNAHRTPAGTVAVTVAWFGG